MALASIVGTYAGGSEAIGPDVQATFDSFLSRINAVTLEQMTVDSVGTSQIIDANVTLAKLPNGMFTVLNGMDKFEDKAITRAKQSNVAKGAGAYVKYEHRTSAGSQGGATVSGVWNTRPITDLQHDSESIGAGTPSGNTFTLPGGTYMIHIDSMVVGAQAHRVRLVIDPSGTPSFVYGMSQFNTSGIETHHGIFNDRVVLSGGTITLGIEHYTQSGNPTFGLGRTANVGGNQIYCVAEFWKVA